jgi:hypothetical protein
VAALVCAVVLLGASVASAHTSVGDDHMGEAAAVCLAVVVAGGAALAAVPRLGRLVPAPPRPVDADCTRAPVPTARRAPGWPRGDPSLLQVLRN